MRKFKTGQKVRVRDDLVVDSFYDGLRFHAGMSRHKGKTATIQGTSPHSKKTYGIDIDLEGYEWSEIMLVEV